jgi:hypothetical protein
MFKNQTTKLKYNISDITIMMMNVKGHDHEDDDDPNFMNVTSLGLKAFSMKVVVSWLRSVDLGCGGNKNIVSVGSGCGLLEKTYTYVHNRPITCVDPAPSKWNNEKKIVFSQPEYARVEEMPSSYKGCLLMLIWAFPGNDYTYDIDAIHALDPASIFVLFERPPGWSNGAAGTEKFHNWLQCVEDGHDKDYKVVCEANTFACCCTNYIMMWIQSTKHEHDIDMNVITLPPTGILTYFGNGDNKKLNT